ncbi:hypothetical protein ACX5DY_005021 [Enterobacter hormaechei]
MHCILQASWNRSEGSLTVEKGLGHDLKAKFLRRFFGDSKASPKHEIVLNVSGDYRYSNCKGKPKGVCSQARENQVRIQHANAAVVFKTRASGSGHHYDAAGLLERPITP